MAHAVCSPAAAQLCTNPGTLTQAETWLQGVSVNVNIDPGYNTDQRAAIAKAFSNWNAAKTLNCSLVTFKTPTYNSSPIAGPGVTNTASLRYQVYKQDPPAHPTDRGHTLGVSNNGRNLAVWTYLHTFVIAPAALTQVMAHEIGHAMIGRMH
jgi:Zn-dependent protease with chaperone function